MFAQQISLTAVVHAGIPAICVMYLHDNIENQVQNISIRSGPLTGNKKITKNIGYQNLLPEPNCIRPRKDI